MENQSGLSLSDETLEEEVKLSRSTVTGSQLSIQTESVETEDIELTPCSLSPVEEEFFEAVRSGNKEAVEELIRVKHVNVNCRDLSGETALQIAVEEEATEVVQILLRNKAEIGSALFQAVRNNSLHCVRILVAYDPYFRRNTAQRVLDRNMETVSRRSSGNFDEFLTPLELAVLNGNYKIVEFLVSKGYKVEDPHSQKPQDAAERNEKESMVRLRESLVKLNTYRALASPLYISHSFLHDTRERKDLSKKNAHHSVNDPLLRSIILRRKLKELAGSEGEFREDYRALSEQSENFAVKLLDECRNLDEIAAVMDMPELAKMKEHVHLEEKEQKLSVLNLAIKYRNRKFIAHPYSQVMLNSVVYRGTYGWQHFSLATKFVLGMLYTLIMPLCMLGYILTPSNRVTRKLELPLLKLMSHVCSLLWFLALITASAFQDKFDSFLRLSPLTVIIGIWVVGIIVQEIKQAYHQGIERYLGEWWHLAIIPMILFYVLAAVLWIVGYAVVASDLGEWTIPVGGLQEPTSSNPRRLILLSSSFYSMAVVLTFFEASHFLQVNSTLGPLHLSLMMMMKDIVRFLALFAINVCAFAIAMRKLYSQYVQTSSHVRGPNNTTVSHTFERIEGTLNILFWALFGHVEFSAFELNKDAEITEVTGKLLLGVYSLASVLVALNLLIAMLNNSYKKVDEERDMKWKFVRTRLWMYYVSEASPLPPPFNLVPVEKAATGVRWLARRYRWTNACFGCAKPKESSSARVKTNIKRRRLVLKNLIHRYFSGNRKPSKEELVENTPFPYDEPNENFSTSPDDIQDKLAEVTKTLQTLRFAVKQFRHQVPRA